jgi:hypothetical protein
LRLELDYETVQKLRTMSLCAVVDHLWTLWVLGVFISKESCWTFIGYPLGQEKLPPAKLLRAPQALGNRLCYEALSPSYDRVPGGIKTKKHLTKWVEDNFLAAMVSIRTMHQQLNDEAKESTDRFVDRMSLQRMTHIIKDLQSYSVFDSPMSRLEMLALPFEMETEVDFS